MTDLLDRPAAADTPESEPDKAPVAAAVQPAPRPTTEPAPWAIAAALLGAAAIHFAMAPSHFGESGIEGAGFLASAWAQAVLAIAVLWRPTRLVLASSAVVNVALIAAWVVSRTVGLPFGAHSGHAETVSFVDGVCVALEAAAVLLAVALLLRVAPSLARARGLGLVGVAAALLVTTGAVASPSARDHAAGSHGEHGAAADGHDHGTGAAAADDKGFAALSNGHQHSHATEKPLKPAEMVTLSKQLAVTQPLMAKYPTLGDAIDAGWKQAGPFAPGLGIHFRSPDGYLQDGEGSIASANLPTPMLIFDGTGRDAPLAGFMYLDYKSAGVPQGFAGSNDIWHLHERVCIVMNDQGEIETPLGADDDTITEETCAKVGGNLIHQTGYMVHLWNVPGYESPDGMFHELNRKITCPDGTYYKIPNDQVGNKDTVCKNA